MTRIINADSDSAEEEEEEKEWLNLRDLNGFWFRPKCFEFKQT